MLNNEPRRFRSILADCLFVRSATFVDDHFEPLCIPDVHRFHAWNIASADSPDSTSSRRIRTSSVRMAANSSLCVFLGRTLTAHR